MRLLTFLDKVTNCVDKCIDVDVIFLNLAKAFDKVPHTKVRNHGIQGLIDN